MHDAFNLYPLTIFIAGEQLGESDGFSLTGQAGDSHDGDARAIDDGSEVAWRTNAGDIDERAGDRRWPGPDCSNGDAGVDAAGAVMQEEGDAPRVQVGVVIGNDGADTNGVAAAGLCRQRGRGPPARWSECGEAALRCSAKVDSGQPVVVPGCCGRNQRQ